MFSYDLGIDDITPDRGYANRNVILDQIESLLQGCTNEEVIETVLKAAVDNPHAEYDEFQALNKSRKEKLETDLRKNYNLIEKENKMEIKSGDFFSKSNPWVQTFKSLYGDTAVLASDDSNVNTDAEILGFKPIRFNHGIKIHLQNLGVETANKIATGTKEYRWVDIADLTTDELAVYHLIPDLNQTAFGKNDTVPLEKVRIYQGMYFPSGREAESSLGVTITEKDGTQYIGIKRSSLQDRTEFATTYFHEAGHYITKKSDYDREHTDFGYGHMAKLALEKIATEK